MKPVVNRLKTEYEGKVDFQLYNVETSSVGGSLAQKYGVTAVPTFIFLSSDGSVSSQAAGALSESELKKTLDALK